MMTIWGIVGGCSLLLGAWIYERLPRWRAAVVRARREPLAEEEFGEQFFSPDSARIAARLRRIAAEQLGKDLSRLHPDDSLAWALSSGFDSLDTVEMLMAIEEEFGIELEDAAVTNIATFRELVQAVASRRPFLVRWRQQMGRATEERFGVSLSRGALADVATPNELAEAVAAELGNRVGAEDSCQSRRAFYLLRSAMMRAWNVPRSLVRPETPLRELIRRRTPCPAWAQLQNAVGAQPWPALRRPRWMSWLVYGLPPLLGAAVIAGLPPLAERAASGAGALGFLLSFASELRLFFVAPLMILFWLLLARVSKRCRRALPRNIRTVGDLVPFVKTSAEMTWTPEEIRREIQKMVVGQLRVAAESYRAGARFVEEFGLGVGIDQT